jgi:hypothetical protein
MNGTYQLLVYGDGVSLLNKNKRYCKETQKVCQILVRKWVQN